MSRACRASASPPTSPERDPWQGLRSRPVLCTAAGAFTLGFSGIVFRLAEVTATTGAFFRFTLSLPFLAALAVRERGPGRSVSAAALAAGVLLALDLILWHLALEDVGAGLGTVLGNTQVVFMVALGWTVFDERLTPRSASGTALVLAGVILISGMLEAAPFGGHPVRGTLYGVAAGLTSALYILMLRAASLDPRRPVRPLLAATVIAVIVTWSIGQAMGDIDLTPSPTALGWLLLLAVSSQVVGWLLLSVPLRTLPATTTSIVLNIQPVAALVFASLLLGETPSGLQLAGGVVTLGALVIATGGRRDR